TFGAGVSQVQFGSAWAGASPGPVSPLPAPPELIRVDPVLGQLQLEVLAVHAHVLGSLRDVALVAAQGLGDELTLETFDDALLGILEAPGRPLLAPPVRSGLGPDGRGEVVESDVLAGGP